MTPCLPFLHLKQVKVYTSVSPTERRSMQSCWMFKYAHQTGKFSSSTIDYRLTASQEPSVLHLYKRKFINICFSMKRNNVCLKKVAKAYNKHKLSFANVWNDLCVTSEDSTHKYKGVWAQVKLFHKYVHVNWYWSLIHNILSLDQKSQIFDF